MSTVYVGSRVASAARTQLLAATSRTPPAGLAEVLGHAALDTRADLKYVLPLGTVPALLARLGPRFRVLEINGRRSFGYRSIYFDTPELLSYRQHLQGNRRRFKVRTRTYVDSADCVLEVKTRGPRSATVKHRKPHPADQPDQLSAAWRWRCWTIMCAPNRGAAPSGAISPGRRCPARRPGWAQRSTSRAPGGTHRDGRACSAATDHRDPGRTDQATGTAETSTRNHPCDALWYDCFS